jgi:hypothetical protein
MGKCALDWCANCAMEKCKIETPYLVYRSMVISVCQRYDGMWRTYGYDAQSIAYQTVANSRNNAVRLAKNRIRESQWEKEFGRLLEPF